VTGLARLAFAALLCTAACGGSSSGGGSATVSGNVAGKPLNVQGTFSAPFDFMVNGSVQAVGGVVVITDSALACGDFASNVSPKNGRALGFIFTDRENGSFAAITPGTFPLVSVNDPNQPQTGRSAFGAVQSFDASCGSTSSGFATGGKLVVTAVDGSGALSGTFDVTTDAGEHITGSFASTHCGTLQTQNDAGAVCR
jgi:hypothetical protein